MECIQKKMIEKQDRKKIVTFGKKTYRLFSNLPPMDNNPINPIENEYAKGYHALPNILLSNVRPTIDPNISTATLGLRQRAPKPLPSPGLALDENLQSISPREENFSPRCSMM